MSEPRPPTQKAMLFCPRCGHASPPTGDWTGTDERVVCPRCGVVLTRRTVPGRLPA